MWFRRGFGENTRQVDARCVRKQIEAAALFVGLERATEPGKSGEIALGLERQPIKCGFQRIGLQRRRIPFPAGAQLT